MQNFQCEDGLPKFRVRPQSFELVIGTLLSRGTSGGRTGVGGIPREGNTARSDCGGRSIFMASEGGIFDERPGGPDIDMSKGLAEITRGAVGEVGHDIGRTCETGKECVEDGH